MSLFFIIGMPAAGKSYWGRKIATKFSMAFTDLDEYIEQQEHVEIAAIFKTNGEAIFREKEHRYLEQIITSANRDTVIACGGGTPCFYDNMWIMKQYGTVIYLDSSIAAIVLNIENSKQNRPLLNSAESISNQINNLLLERKSIYEQAHYIFNVNEDVITQFEKMLILVK